VNAYFKLDGHWNDKGNRVVSEIMTRKISHLP
jgi:hypothetical protein